MAHPNADNVNDRIVRACTQRSLELLCEDGDVGGPREAMSLAGGVVVARDGVYTDQEGTRALWRAVSEVQE